jgi:hypothetical protein
MAQSVSYAVHSLNRQQFALLIARRGAPCLTSWAATWFIFVLASGR